MRRHRISQFKFDKAREMRDNPTPAEARMWELLKREVIPNFPEHIFYRQSIQFGYVLDFYCPTLRLGIEVDGDIHDDRKRYDWQRDTNLARRRVQVYRFSNADVFNNPQGIATQLCQIIQDKKTPWYKKIFRF